MSGRRWFGGKTPAEAGASLVHSLFSPLFRPAPPPAPAAILSQIDSSADACWTASLDRGDGLPPFLLSINMVAGCCSAVRFEARAGRDCGNSARSDL